MVRWMELAGAERQGRADGELGIPFEFGDEPGEGAPVAWDDKQVTFYLTEVEALAGQRQARALARAQAKVRSLTPRLLTAAEAVLATDAVLSGDPPPSPPAAGAWLSREAVTQARAGSAKAAEAVGARKRQKAERERFVALLGRLAAIVAGAHKKALQHVAFANRISGRYCTAVTRAYRRHAEPGHGRRFRRAWSPPLIKPAEPWKDAVDSLSYEILLTEEAAELVRKAEQCIAR